MLLLAIERSSASGGAVLFRDGACLAGCAWTAGGATAPAWMADVGRLLDETGTPAAKLDLVAVGLGPGSFSGIRGAVAGAQGLALPHGVPLAGVSSAAALAWRWLRENPATTGVAVVGDARRGKLWAGWFARAADGSLAVVTSRGAAERPVHGAGDFLLPARAELASLIRPGTEVITPEWDRLGGELAQLLPAGILRPCAPSPRAEDVARLVCADPGAAVREPVPIYLHPPVAAVNRER